MLAVLIGIVGAVIVFLIILVLMLGGASALFPSKLPPRFRLPRQNEPRIGADDLFPEDEFDHATARPNHFAQSPEANQEVTVALAPDVAQFFKTADAVNAVLRALIATMPATAGRRKKPTES